jgi:hypothetical protein
VRPCSSWPVGGAQSAPDHGAVSGDYLVTWVVVQGTDVLRSIVVVDVNVLLRAVEVYEYDPLDFAQAYLLACAETTGVGMVASFDRSINRVPQSAASFLEVETHQRETTARRGARVALRSRCRRRRR